jgi:hypothetical protein
VGSPVLSGTLSSGFVAARYSRQLSRDRVRAFVIFASIGITTYHFYRTWT